MWQFNFSVICVPLEENLQEKVARSGEKKQQLPIAQIFSLKRLSSQPSSLKLSPRPRSGVVVD